MSLGEKAGIVILVSDKIDFKTKQVTRDKNEHFVTRGTIHQEYLTFLNIYAHNLGTPK